MSEPKADSGAAVPCISLLACPFCGGEAEMIHADGRTGVVDHWQVACAGNDCLAVPHTPFFEAEHDAAAAWNNRHANNAAQGRPTKEDVP
jgi:hypothetical protein